jgi:hypothetical protein
MDNPTTRQAGVGAEQHRTDSQHDGATPWRQQLHRLEPLNLPLLPCGAGAEGKGPINPKTGKGLLRWTTARFEVPQILRMNGVVRSVGTRTGEGVLCLDIDGGTAIELALAHGCDPQQAQTWQVHRDTDPLRLKVLWQLSALQQSELGEISAKAHTAPPADGRKGEALEVFHSPGRQVLLLGEHVPSNGFYFWPDGMGPEALAPIPPAWWELTKKIAAGELGLPAVSARTAGKAKGSSSGREWQPADPCPICGRHSGKDRPSSYCSRNRSSGAIRCFHGSTYSPELAHPGALQKIGDRVTGTDGTVYGWCGAEAQGGNHDVFSTFRVHQEREPRCDSPAVLRSEIEDSMVRRRTDHQDGHQGEPTKFTPRPDSTARWGQRRLSPTRARACLERCIWIQASRERNGLRRRARLLRAAADLGLSKYINRQEIAQLVMEAKDQQQGRGFACLSAADRSAMDRPTVEWLLPGIVPARDLTIIGGRPKTGKTRLAMAAAEAVLNGRSFMENPAPQPGTVILVSDDQADGDTADMLDSLNIWDHPRLLWSRHFRLTESDLESLLQVIRQNPGALIILDSLRSIGRSLQFGENDPEIGAMLYDLKAAVVTAGGTLVIIHHCNKADGLTGTEALSGHSAIAGAANSIVTLHYLPDDKGRPLKDAPQRRMVREARSGRPLDLVISPVAGTGRFYAVGTFSDWQRQQQEAGDEEKKIGRMPESQKRVLAAVSAADGWVTRRQVCDALGIDWGVGGRTGQPRGVDDALGALVQKNLLESLSVKGVITYQLSSRRTQIDVTSVNSVTPSHANESRVTDESVTSVTGVTPTDAGFGVSRCSRDARDTEKPCGDWVSRLSRLSREGEGNASPPPTPLPSLTPLPPAEVIEHLLHLLAVAPKVEPHPHTLALGLEAAGLGSFTGKQVKAWIEAIPECNPTTPPDLLDLEAAA